MREDRGYGLTYLLLFRPVLAVFASPVIALEELHEAENRVTRICWIDTKGLRICMRNKLTP